MAIEKAKVLAVLSTKFKGKSLSKTFLDKTATRYAAKIDTEADLDDYINDREDDILAAGEEADRRVTAATKKITATVTDPKKEVVEIDEDELKDAPTYVKALMKKLEGMEAKVLEFQAEKTAGTIEKRFLEDVRLKGINPKLLKGRVPKTEEELEDAINETAEDLKEFVVVEGVKPTGRTLVSDRPGFAGAKSAGASAGSQTEKVPEAITKFTAGLNKSVNNNSQVKS